MVEKMAIALALVLAAILGGGHGLLSTHPSRAHRPAGEIAPSPAAAAPEQSGIRIRDLKPIVVNLAAPSGAWARLESAIALKTGSVEAADQDVAAVTNDFLNFLRTVSADELQGGYGLQVLRDELEERAKLRTDRRVSEVFIQTLIVQ